MQLGIAGWIGGFVAAEGSFTLHETSSKSRFRLAISLGAADYESCATIHRFFGVGTIGTYPRRQPHHDDVVTYVIQSLPDLINFVVPFMDEHLPPSHKRSQYLKWRERLLHYWEHKAKRVRRCTTPGCDRRRRAHGLCRHHLYEEWGY